MYLNTLGRAATEKARRPVAIYPEEVWPLESGPVRNLVSASDGS